jgi:hypothetical protein
MGFLDRLLGRNNTPTYGSAPPPAPGRRPAPPDSDEAAIERYKYLLRTAPPDRIEAAHSEAFATLTPDQRQEVLRRLAAEGETPASDSPQDLARTATRAEMRRPGTLERSFGGGRGGMGGVGMGGIIAGSLLTSIAGAFIGTAIADAMFDMSDSEGAEAAEGGEGGDTGDAGGDAGGDVEAAGDYGGGDFGGGDFGGGDFGGGDFGGF